MIDFHQPTKKQLSINGISRHLVNFFCHGKVNCWHKWCAISILVFFSISLPAVIYCVISGWYTHLENTCVHTQSQVNSNCSIIIYNYTPCRCNWLPSFLISKHKLEYCKKLFDFWNIVLFETRFMSFGAVHTLRTKTTGSWVDSSLTWVISRWIPWPLSHPYFPLFYKIKPQKIIKKWSPFCLAYITS